MRRLAFALVIAAVGCGDDVAQPEEVRDLRVLAIRADPPEVFVDTDPSTSVVFSALVVDPREPALASRAVDYTWSLCPIESNEACLDFEEQRNEAPQDTRAFLDELRSISESGTAYLEPQAQGLSADEAATRAVWPYAITDNQLELSQSQHQQLAAYFVQYNLLGRGMGALPSVVLEINGHDDAIRAEKRFTMNVHDVAQASTTFGFDFGYTVCAEGQDESTGCVALRPRDRNNNPTFDGLQVSLGSLAGGDFFDVQGSFTMSAGSTIRILPVFTSDSYEVYQELITDTDSGRIYARDETEILSVSWFANAGDLEDALTTPIYTKTLDTEYSSPGNVSADGLAVTVYMVARDQRGGIAWQSLEIQVTP